MKQVKIVVDEGVANRFKQTCAASDTSMAQVITNFMMGYTNTTKAKRTIVDYTTRKKRRIVVDRIIRQLEEIKLAEELGRDNTPVNLQGTENYERTEELIEILDEAIDILASGWMVP
jgi:hypothetical protein